MGGMESFTGTEGSDCAQGPRPRFLVIDDDPTLCRVVGSILSAFGDVVVAMSLADAHRVLDIIRDLAAAVVDVILKPGSGIDIVDRLQAEHPGLPTLVITGDLVPERINDAHCPARRWRPSLAKPDSQERSFGLGRLA